LWDMRSAKATVTKGTGSSRLAVRLEQSIPTSRRQVREQCCDLDDELRRLSMREHEPWR
jgi:hypothetical protein